MIEQNLYIGGSLEWLARCSSAPQPIVNNNFNVNLLLQARFCSQCVITLQHNCLFLPYVPGYINYVCTIGPRDVFSYPFSGCYMASFQIGNFFYYVHVSTPECNMTWDNFKRNNLIQNLTEFKPHQWGTNTTGDNRVFGLITDNFRKYSIVVRQENTQYMCPYRNVPQCQYAIICKKFTVTDIIEHI